MVIDRMETEVPSCQLNDSLGEAKRRAEKVGFDLCPVVNEKGIVLGLVREEMWKEGQAMGVEKVMELGPTTFRPSYSVDEVTEFLGKQGWDAALVTSSDGKLMGIFRRNLAPEKKQIPKSEIWA